MLFRHPAVKEAAVNAVRGEAVKAYVVLAETVEFVDALPKNPTGKILEKELRRLTANIGSPCRCRLHYE